MNKILIVEDDPMLSEIYSKKFSSGGFSVINAFTGTEAVSKAKAEKPDIVMLDLVIPEEDGFEVLKELKDDPTISNTKVIIFSNLSQDEDLQKAEALGANGFIVKSDFTPQQIVDEVQKIISGGKSDAMSQSYIKVDSKKTVQKNGRKKVLIVEDEQVFIDVFGKKLEDSGYSVEVAKNGAWGLQKLKDEKYDLLLLDVVMPVFDGFDVLKEIREGGINQKTPIVVFTNSVLEEKKEEFLNAGANDFIIKSKVTPSELVEKINGIIGD